VFIYLVLFYSHFFLNLNPPAFSVCCLLFVGLFHAAQNPPNPSLPPKEFSRRRRGKSLSLLIFGDFFFHRKTLQSGNFTLKQNP
ncbi:MAG: hypothetical protein AAF849_24630, partial [Bacteroidota bacterium]